MNEMCCFQTPCLRILMLTSIEIVQSHFKLRHQVASTTTSTSFLTPPPPPRGHPLPPSSALANAHLWANPGQACRHQQSPAPPHHHLSAAAPMLPAPATTWRTTTTSWDGWRRVRRVGRRGKGDLEGDDDTACNPHATSSIYFLCAVWRCGVQPTRRVVYLFPLCCLTTWHATHTPCHLFLFLSVVWWRSVQPTRHIVYFFSSVLFDDAVCNPHAALSISSLNAAWRRGNPHAALSISSFNVAWQRGVQPTCHIVYFFLQCCLMTWRATHMPCCLFLSLHLVYFFLSMLFDDAAYNPHAVLSIYFYFYLYILLDFIRSVLEYNL